MDSLGSELYEQIVDRLPDDIPTFHHAWMLLLQLLTSDSPHRFADIKKKLLAICPQDYPGQDISAMCLDVKKHYRSLLTAGAGVFDLNDTEKIIDAFALADGDDRYRKRIVDKETDLDTALQFIRFMSDYDASLKHLCSQNVDVESICTLAEDQYRLALSNHRWMPALHTPDAKKPPETFSQTQINALIQQIHPSTPPPTVTKAKIAVCCVENWDIGPLTVPNATTLETTGTIVDAATVVAVVEAVVAVVVVVVVEVAVATVMLAVAVGDKVPAIAPLVLPPGN